MNVIKKFVGHWFVVCGLLALERWAVALRKQKCASLRKEFRANQVSFEDIDVDKTGDKNQLLHTMGINGYPATWVDYTRVKNGSSFSEVMALVKQSQ